MTDQSRLKLSWEVATLRESFTRGERGVQRDKHEAARPKGKLSQALREANRRKSCTNHDPPSAEEVGQSSRHTLDLSLSSADVPSALILPSEEQYSKCTYPLCFDFSQCPLTQPFHIFVYNHHFRNLFNLKYPTTVDSFVTQSSTQSPSLLIPPDLITDAVDTHRAVERRRRR